MSKKLKIVGLALFAVCAIMAVAAGAAQATPNWTVETEGKATIPKSTESYQITLAKEEETNTVMSTLNVPGLLELKGTGIHLNGAKLFGEKFDSVESIVFTNVVVASASTVCQAQGATKADPVGTVTTVPLSTELVTIGGIAYDTFKPASGTEFVKIKITAKSGKSCPISGTQTITGSIVGTVPVTGVLSTSNPLVFSEADEKAVEPTDALKYGTSAAYLTTTVNLKLEGDQKWGVDW
jgi:hypothetical protein